MPTASQTVAETRGEGNQVVSGFSGIRPRIEIRDTGRHKRSMPGALAGIRARFGPDLQILHDVQHRLLPREAAEFAKAVEAARLFWLEDPTPAEDQDALNLLRLHSTPPIAVGAVFTSICDCTRRIGTELIDFIRVAAPCALGITPVKRISDPAGPHRVRTRGAHGAPIHAPL